MESVTEITFEGGVLAEENFAAGWRRQGRSKSPPSRKMREKGGAPGGMFVLFFVVEGVAFGADLNFRFFASSADLGLVGDYLVVLGERFDFCDFS